MKNLYQTAKNYIAKPLIGLALIAGVSGCDQNLNNQEYPPKTTDRPAYSSSINEFGVMAYQNPEHRGWEERTSVAVADMDGDGDLDVIVSNAFGEVIVLENNIPQKK